MLKREDYLLIIEEIRNIDEKSMDQYIKEVIEPYRQKNSNFIEILYKDVYYLIKDIDKPGENDLIIENGNLVIEAGELKLSRYQSRLHTLSGWLHFELCKDFMKDNPNSFISKIENFETNFLKKSNYTPEYRVKLDKIKKSLKKERIINLHEKDNFWNKVLDTDNLELKPNIFGIGINFNALINNFKKN